jgi:hypothetical protein
MARFLPLTWEEQGRLGETQIILQPLLFSSEHRNPHLLSPIRMAPREKQRGTDSVCPAKFAKSCVSDSRPRGPDNEIEIAYQ